MHHFYSFWPRELLFSSFNAGSKEFQSFSPEHSPLGGSDKALACLWEARGGWCECACEGKRSSCQGFMLMLVGFRTRSVWKRESTYSPKGVSTQHKSWAKISRLFPMCHISAVSIAKWKCFKDLSTTPLSNPHSWYLSTPGAFAITDS